jgi:hypothetical protein
MDYKLVALKSIQYGSKFYTSFEKGDRPEYLADGSLGYEILGYGNTAEDMEKILYSNIKEAAKTLHNYLLKILEEQAQREMESLIRRNHVRSE